MTSRERILAEVRKNQPGLRPLPDVVFKGTGQNIVQAYMETFIAIGGKAVAVDTVSSVKALIREGFDTGKRIITTLPDFSDSFELFSPEADPHTFEDVELALIRAHLAVAENGTVWLTEADMGHRIIPFICQHLAVIVEAGAVVPTMHEAYKVIGGGEYGFGVFIGGPSKTADIEQSLVLGAHGPISMTVFIIK